MKNQKAIRKKKRKAQNAAPSKRFVRSLALALCIICTICVYVPAGQQDSSSDPKYSAQVAPMPAAFDKTQPLDNLEKQIFSMADQPKLHLGAFAVEPATGRYVSVNGEETFAAASMIKVPVLVQLLDAIDKGEVSPDEILVMRKDLIGGGSGFLQWRPVDSKVSLKEAMETMIIFSDNTATNLIIDRLGGKDVCNRAYSYWGLKHTYINNWLPDLEGTNKTSPYDLVELLARVDKGDLLQPDSRKRMMAIMEKTRIKTLLPFGLPPGAKIAHKTGDIGSLVGDCGIIDSPEPDGKHFIACIQVSRPHNDRRANELIRQVSRVLYAEMVPGGASQQIAYSQTPRRRHRRHRGSSM